MNVNGCVAIDKEKAGTNKNCASSFFAYIMYIHFNKTSMCFSTNAKPLRIKVSIDVF